MGHLEGNLRPSYIWDARFLKVNSENFEENDPAADLNYQVYILPK